MKATSPDAALAPSAIEMLLAHGEPWRAPRRLRLVAVTHEMKLALRRSPAALATAIGATVPAHWPQFPQAFEPGVPASRPVAPWRGFFFLLRAEPTLVGNGGFVSAPDARGEVEIGYEIAPALRGRGHASEAARALVQIAFAHGARAVVAHTLARRDASNTVLAKVGLQFAAELAHERLGAVWRYRIERPATPARP